MRSRHIHGGCHWLQLALVVFLPITGAISLLALEQLTLWSGDSCMFVNVEVVVVAMRWWWLNDGRRVHVLVHVVVFLCNSWSIILWWSVDVYV